MNSFPRVSDNSLLTFNLLRASGRYLGMLCLLSNASPAVGFSGSNFSLIPSKPQARDAAIARYGLVSAPGILFSILLELAWESYRAMFHESQRVIFRDLQNTSKEHGLRSGNNNGHLLGRKKI